MQTPWRVTEITSEILAIKKSIIRNLNTTSWELQDLRIKQSNVKIRELKDTAEMIQKQRTKIPNWKAPGIDGVHYYWIKNFNLCRREYLYSNKWNFIILKQCNYAEGGRTVGKLLLIFIQHNFWGLNYVFKKPLEDFVAIYLREILSLSTKSIYQFLYMSL